MREVLLAAFVFVAMAGPATAQNASPMLVETQEFNSLPTLSLTCYQDGHAIFTHRNLDHVRLFRDNAGILRRIDYKTDPDDWQTLAIAQNTTCNVVAQP